MLTYNENLSSFADVQGGMKIRLVSDSAAHKTWQWRRICGLRALRVEADEGAACLGREFTTHRFCCFQFLYPLPRAGGYEFFVQQFDGNQMHFTPLLELQVRNNR